jgi:hypothetical protein
MFIKINGYLIRVDSIIFITEVIKTDSGVTGYFEIHFNNNKYVFIKGSLSSVRDVAEQLEDIIRKNHSNIKQTCSDIEVEFSFSKGDLT